MSFVLTDTAQDETTKTLKKPAIVLEIDGHDRLYTIGDASAFPNPIRVGDIGLFIGSSWVIGGSKPRIDVDGYITLDGTSTSISQQLQQDKGGATSVTSMQISLADFHSEITELVSPGKKLDDILGRDAFVYLGFQGTVFPRDYIPIFIGIIDEVTSGANITLNIANAEQKKRQEIFPVIETELDGAINNSQTSITLKSSANLVLPVTDKLETYIKVNDEIIRFTGISTNTLTGCTRAQFGTIAASATSGGSVSTFNRLMGNPIDLALELMLSSVDEYYKTDITVSNFVTDLYGNDEPNTLVFINVNVKNKYGLTVGDFITTSGASNGSNNFTLRTITSISVDDDGSIVTVDGASLVAEVASTAKASFKSRYNVLPDGVGLGAHQVDVDEYNRIYDLFSGSLPIYDFYVTDTIKAKEFIDKEIMFPANLFTLPKKGKISLGVVSPPLNVGTVKVLNKDTITNPSNIKIKRSIGKYFYNTVIYKYNYDAVDTSKPLTGYILVDEDSKNQIKIGTRALTIEGKGLRNDNDTNATLATNARRLLEKYKFAAEYITVSGFYGTLFNSDVGDIVLFGDESLPLVDSKLGARGFKPRLCEIIDKKMDLKTGRVDVTLLDTSYLTDGRYGIISPSSIIGSGSTDSTLVITDSFSTVSPDIEKNKWIPYIGENLFIHNDDWSVSYESKLLGFASNYTMNISNIGVSLPAGYIVDIANYPSTSVATDNINLKNTFVFTNPSVQVVSGTDGFTFDVDSGDVSKLIIGNQIMLHNVDWSSHSNDVRITAIDTNTVTVDKDLGFTPDNTYTVELIGFVDSGSSYRYL
jgi:hypothetical protein